MILKTNSYSCISCWKSGFSVSKNYHSVLGSYVRFRSSNWANNLGQNKIINNFREESRHWSQEI